MWIGVGTVILIILILCFIFSQQIAMILFVVAAVLLLIGILISLFTRDIGSGVCFFVYSVIVGIIGLIMYFDHEPIISKSYSFNPVTIKTIHVKVVDNNWTPYIYYYGDQNENALGDLPGKKMEDKDNDGWYDISISTKCEYYHWIITDGNIEHQSKEIFGVGETWVEVGSEFYIDSSDSINTYSFNPDY